MNNQKTGKNFYGVQRSRRRRLTWIKLFITLVLMIVGAVTLYSLAVWMHDFWSALLIWLVPAVYIILLCLNAVAEADPQKCLRALTKEEVSNRKSKGQGLGSAVYYDKLNADELAERERKAQEEADAAAEQARENVSPWNIGAIGIHTDAPWCVDDDDDD